MPFTYKKTLVTLQNYMTIFSNLNIEFQDEIRSAVLDDTQIGYVLSICVQRGDIYALSQLRCAIKEYLPKEYINPNLSGECVRILRRLYALNINLEPISKYIASNTKFTLDNDTLELILKAYVNGATNIDRVDFNTIPSDMIQIVCEGLQKSYPMWLITDFTSNTLSNEYIKTLMKCMTLNIDVHPFLSIQWDLDTIRLLLLECKNVDVNTLLGYINNKFSTGHIKEILTVARASCDFTKLCVQDSDSYPLYNEYQLAVLGKAVMLDIDISFISDFRIDDVTMNTMLSDVIATRKRESGTTFKISLPKLKK